MEKLNYKKEKDGEEGKNPFRFRAEDEAAYEQIDDKERAQYRCDHAEEGEHLERHQGKTRHKIKVQTDEIV